MCMYDRRLQILLDEGRFRRVEAVARERRLSIAAVIRDAIDLALPPDLEKKRRALAAIKAAKPMAVPERIEDFKAELDEIRSGGL